MIDLYKLGTRRYIEVTCEAPFGAIGWVTYLMRVEQPAPVGRVTFLEVDGALIMAPDAGDTMLVGSRPQGISAPVPEEYAMKIVEGMNLVFRHSPCSGRSKAVFSELREIQRPRLFDYREQTTSFVLPAKLSPEPAVPAG